MNDRSPSSQSGSAFLALFGAVAMLGVIGAGLNMVIRGPVTTMSDVTKRTVAESSMLSSAKLAVVMASTAQASSGDCDADGYVEPFPFRSAGALAKPSGGGYIPTQLGSNTKDPWNTEFGYCAWDHGPKTTTDNVAGCGGSGANRLKGANNGNQMSIAIISAGKDRTFQTSCNAFVDANADGNPDTPLIGKVGGSDDLVTGYTYAEANNVGGGGLWQMKNGSSTTATIGKDIEVSGSATLAGTLRLGGGLVLSGDPGNNSVTGPCNAANDQQLRRNTSTTPPTIEICNFAGGGTIWQPVSSAVPTAMPTPGSACTAADAGAFRMGKPASLPDGYILTCSGSVWNTLFKYNLSTGIVEVPLSPTSTKQVANKGYVDLAITNAKLPVCEANEYYIRTASGYSCYCDRPGPPFWTQRTSLGTKNFFGTASSADGTKLVASVYGGYLYTSTDSGATWTERTSSGSRNWINVASSADGTKLVAEVQNGIIYTSADSGATWTARSGMGNQPWVGIASSADGTKLAATAFTGYVFTSVDSGVTWTQRSSSGARNWRNIASSSDGTKLAAAVDTGYIYTSADSGATWTERTSAGSRVWLGIASSADGTILYATVHAGSGAIYRSTDSGATWSEVTTAGLRLWYDIGISSDATKIVASTLNDYVYVSSDSGGTWARQTSLGTSQWRQVALASSGSKAAIAKNNEYIYTYASVCKGCYVRPANVSLTPGQTGTFFPSATAPYGTCTGETRTCNAGVLSGAAGHASCLGVFSQLSVGSQHVCSLTSTGQTWCWGDNSAGQLADGSTVNKLIPTSILGGHLFKFLGRSGNVACALKSDDSAWCWGVNGNGQVGDNTTVNKSVPTAVSGGHSFVFITSRGHTCALKSDGSAWCWGGNSNGQLGDNTLVSKSIPTIVSGSHSFTKIATGGNHTCALKTDGTAFCWGSNGSGEMGDNTTVAKSIPTVVAGGHLFREITAGRFNYSCALKFDGSAWCWGNNVGGQLGDGTNVTKTAPVAVSGGHQFISITAGQNHTCGLKSDGSAWCWGVNASGALGDGATAPQNTPTAVTGGHIFESVEAGDAFTCGMKTSKEVFCWGSNAFGRIGDNTTTNRLTPTPIYQP